MKTKMKFLMYGIFVLFLAFTSCNGEDGAIGPQGPPGINGVDGEDGNANVIASDWVATDFSTTATTFTFFEIKDTNIIESITDKSAILAYGKVESTNGFTSIPIVTDNKSYYFGIFPTTNKIVFFGSSTDNNSHVFNDLSEVRYVIIPSAANKGGKKRDFTKMSYEEVMDYFNLPY